MGKPTTTQNNGFINHFSHPHRLQLTPTASAPPCSACKLFGGPGRSYTCKPCNFSLHESCSKMKQVITHPSHPSHPLNLLVAPVYDGGCFNCDACGINGTGFSYHCARCDFDIHALCAYKPLSIIDNSHPQHNLKLVFQSPYGVNKGFSCDICLQISKNQWLYRCMPCEFDAHVGCITAPHPHVLQHSTSAPSPYIHQAGHPQHQTSLPIQGNNRPRSRPMTGPSGPIRNPNRPIAQNGNAYSPRRQNKNIGYCQNNNIGYSGQIGPILQDELIGQVGQSFGEGSTEGRGYDGNEGNEEFDNGVNVEVEYEGVEEAIDEGENVDGNELQMVAYADDNVATRSESEFGGSSDSRSQCNDLADADLYPLSPDITQVPLCINQGSRRGGKKNTNRNDQAARSKNMVLNGPRDGPQRPKTQSPREPQTRNVQNVRNSGRRAGGAVSVRVNRSRDLPAFVGPQGFNGPNNGPSNGPSNDGSNNDNYNEVDATDSYVGENNDGFEEGYGDDFVGSVDVDCEFEGGGDFEVDCEFEVGGYSLEDGDDEAYDETYSENDLGSYSDFTGGSESMYDGEYGTMDDSQYIGSNDEPNNQYSPMVGPVGGPMYNQPGRPMNRRMNGRGGTANMNMYGNMNQSANNTQPRAMGRQVQYRPNGGVYRVNGRPNGPNGPNGISNGFNGPNNGLGNTLVNTMVQGLCQDFAMNMLGGSGGGGGGIFDGGAGDCGVGGGGVVDGGVGESGGGDFFDG